MTNHPDNKKTRINLWRRLTQVLFVFLLNPYFFTAKSICFPVLNCWACPVAAFSCPIGALGQFLALGIFPFLVLGTLILFGALIGRMLCGWVCPFGLLQDLLHKIPSPKIGLPGFLKYGKYLVLLIMVILIPLFFGIYPAGEGVVPQKFFFCYLCPAGTLEANIPLALMADEAGEAEDDAGDAKTQEMFKSSSEQSVLQSFMKSPRFWILIIFLVTFVFITRPFCRAICPLGAIFAIFNKVSLHKMRVDKDKCIECNLCKKVCPTDVRIYKNSSSPECVRCLVCQKKCPTEAIENQYF